MAFSLTEALTYFNTAAILSYLVNQIVLSFYGSQR